MLADSESASLDVPFWCVTAALLLGLPTMILTSRSIPIRSRGRRCDGEVEHGRIETYVGVYERSQIAVCKPIQSNVAGLAERDRLHDCRPLRGNDVAHRASKKCIAVWRCVEAAVLFIDLVGSTQLARAAPPQEVPRC